VDNTTLLRIREILPSYDSLPDLLTTLQAAELIGVKPNTLPADRCGRRTFNIGFVRCGRLIRYPKLEVGKWLLRNAVGVGAEDGE
jgi:hypothetical protein